MANEVCFATLQCDQPWTLENYLKVGGYQAWGTILRGELTSREQMIDEVKKSGLRGRGGAGFPTGLKWSFMPRKAPGQKYIVCNSDESEPGTCKDRDILRFNPHAADRGHGHRRLRHRRHGRLQLHARRVSPRALRALRAGARRRPMPPVCSARIFTAPASTSICYGHLGAGAYICGEETALLESLEGKKGQPRFKPPFPANYGLYGRPTTINNTETLASVPAILRNGGEWFLKLGKPNNGGTKIFSVSGHVNQPGNFEVPMGTPFRDLLEMAGGVRTGASSRR